MLEKLKQVNWVLFVLITLGLRSLYSADIAQSLIVMSFSAMYGYKMFLDNNKSAPLDQEVKSQLDEMKTTVAGIAMRNATKPQQMKQELQRFF